MREPLVGWLRSSFRDTYHRVIPERTQELEMRTDLPIGIPGERHVEWKTYTRTIRELPESSLLRLVDVALVDLAPSMGIVKATMHGISPDDSGACSDAVKAVEIAAQPVVEPANQEATLGGISGVMRTHGRLAPSSARTRSCSYRRDARVDVSLPVSRAPRPALKRQLHRREPRGSRSRCSPGRDSRLVVLVRTRQASSGVAGRPSIGRGAPNA